MQVFFEGVERLLASGVAPHEVSFQLKYSKQELRKCIKEYPPKEVHLQVCGGVHVNVWHGCANI